MSVSGVRRGACGSGMSKVAAVHRACKTSDGFVVFKIKSRTAWSDMSVALRLPLAE